MTSTNLYELNLTDYRRKNCFQKYSKTIRLIIPQNKNDLINLLFNAFSNYHSQDEQARLAIEQDIDNYFSGTVHQPMLDCSWGYWKDGILVGVCLLSYWEKRQSPLLDCIAVKNAWKSRNVSSVVFQASIFSLIHTGQTKMLATISENNTLPMNLAQRIGFQVIQ